MSSEYRGVTSGLFAVAETAGAEPLPGRPLFPVETPEDEYKLEGSPVSDGRVDVHLSSVAAEDGPGYFKAREIGADGQEGRTFDINGEIAAGALGIHKHTRGLCEGYLALVVHIEQRTGRHDMNIVVS